MLAFSTSWNADGRLTPEALLATISALGIDAIELSYRHTEEDVAAISAGSRSMGMGVVSVHNFCPRPAIPDRGGSLSEILLLSSLEEAERQAAIEATRRSIDTAAACGASALILHLGRVEIPSLTRELIALYRCDRAGSKTYREMCNRMVKERAERARPYFERVLMSLDALCPDAARAGVSLAVENRFYHREIPSLDECRIIMERFEGGPVSYWHDIGHAQVMEDLGFCRHEDYLETAGKRLCGFHVHDVLQCEDHLPPSYGTVDFSRFKKYWRHCPVVIELSPSSDTVSVAQGVECVRRELTEDIGRKPDAKNNH